MPIYMIHLQESLLLVNIIPSKSPAIDLSLFSLRNIVTLNSDKEKFRLAGGQLRKSSRVIQYSCTLKLGIKNMLNERYTGFWNFFVPHLVTHFLP